MTGAGQPALAGVWRAGAAAERRLAALASPVFAEPRLQLAGGGALGRGPGGVTVLLAGRLSDASALRRHLPGGGPHDVADAIAAGYALLGDEVFATLHGEWSLVVWEPARGRCVLARDPLGGRSLHYALHDGGVVFGEDVRDVLGLLGRTPGADRLALTAWLGAGVIPLGHSLVEGISAVRGGHAVVVGAGEPRRLCFWKPTREPLLDLPEDELAELLGGEVDAAVGRAIADAAAPGVKLSGGLDSSVVAALARGRGELRAYSAVFPQDADADESALIDIVTERLGLDGWRSVVAGGRVVAGGLPYLQTWLLPSTSPNSFLWLPLLARAAQDGTDVMIDGEGGDEVFDSHPFYLFADLVRRGRLHAAWRLTDRYRGVGPATTPRHRASIIAHFARRGLTPLRVQQLAGRLPGRASSALLAAHDRRRVAELQSPWSWKRGEGPLWWRHRAHVMTTTRQLVDAAGTLRRHAAIAGVRDRHPLMLDRSLVELALRLPGDSAFDPGVDRPLVRRAMAGRLPDEIRLRRGKSHFSNVVRDGMLADRALVRELLGDPRARVRDYVDRRHLDEAVLADDPSTGHPDGLHAWAAEAWRLTAAECWLRQLEDRGFAEELAARTAGAPSLDHALHRRNVAQHST